MPHYQQASRSLVAAKCSCSPPVWTVAAKCSCGLPVWTVAAECSCGLPVWIVAEQGSGTAHGLSLIGLVRYIASAWLLASLQYLHIFLWLALHLLYCVRYNIRAAVSRDIDHGACSRA